MEDLAQQVEAIKNGAHPKTTSAGSSNSPEQATPEAGVPALLEIEDMKRKVVRLTEQVTKNTQDISNVTPVLPRVDLMENQVTQWRYRLPDLIADEGDSDEELVAVTAVEVYEQLGGFKGATRRKIEELRQATVALEDRLNILRRSRDDAWQLVNDRLTTEVDRASATLSDRSSQELREPCNPGVVRLLLLAFRVHLVMKTLHS